jgi:hypothetical protein
MTERTPEYWLRRAAEARADAQQMTDMPARLTVLRIAEGYDWLAIHAALKEAQRERRPKKTEG